MQTGDEKTRATAVVLTQPLSAANGISWSRYHNRLQRRTEHAFNGALPFRIDVQRIGEGADEMKIA